MSFELELPHLGVGVPIARSAVRHTPLPGAPLHPIPARVAVGAAITTGIVADLAGGGEMQGIGITLTMLAAIGSIAASAATVREPAYESGLLHDFTSDESRRHLGARRAGAAILLAFAALLALLQTVRTSDLLGPLNALALLAAVGLAIALLQPATPLDPWSMRVRDVARIAIVRGVDAWTGTLRFLVGDANALLGTEARARLRVSGAVARAVVLTAVMCVILTLLLSSGDPVFERATSWLTHWNLPQLTAHAATIFFVAWPVLGATYATTRPSVIDRNVEQLLDGVIESVTLNRLDTIISLGALNTLFTAFVLVQLRTLFGGQAYVESVTGLTLAEYARSGFFTLVIAVGIVVGVLVALDARSNVGTLSEWPIARRLSRVLLVLLSTVLVSASARMALYIASFGVSIDRIIAVTILVWLGLVLVIVDRFLLRGRRRGFAFATLAAAAVTLMGLNVANPEALVVQAAASRASVGGEVDVQYIADNVKSDGMPALIEALVAGRFSHPGAHASARADGTPSPALGVPVTCALASHALHWADASPIRDARAWSLSTMRARRAVSRHRAELARLGCQPPPA